MPSYRGMNRHCGVHSAIRSLNFFRILSGSIDLRETEATCRVQSRIIRNGLGARFSPHPPNCFLRGNGAGRETLLSSRVASRSARIPLPGLVSRTRGGIAARRSRLKSQSLDMLANVFSKVSIPFSVSTTPAVLSSLLNNPYSYRVM